MVESEKLLKDLNRLENKYKTAAAIRQDGQEKLSEILYKMLCLVEDLPEVDDEDALVYDALEKYKDVTMPEFWEEKLEKEYEKAIKTDADEKTRKKILDKVSTAIEKWFAPDYHGRLYLLMMENR